MDAEQILADCALMADRRLGELLPPESRAPRELHAAMRYSCLAPGKRLRPALCMASAEAVGKAGPAVLDASCAVEMVHCFSLIHDDLPAIDNDDLRRGLPTCHRHFGEALAILAGDALFALAFQTLAGVSMDSRIVAILAMATGSDGLVGGEVADVLSEGAPVSMESIQFIHARKTGALIAASCEIGGLLAGATAEQGRRLRAFGSQVGLAFQITDDLLNELSSADVLGKTAGSDKGRNKATYPSFFGVGASKRAAVEHVEKGITELGEMPHGTASLAALARYSVQRLR